MRLREKMNKSNVLINEEYRSGEGDIFNVAL